jgi:tRNA nucleotidyltransferase (CCA-adding enzyme)
MKHEKILDEVVDKIRPTQKEISELNEIANRFISSLKAQGLSAYVGGSLAKGTMVKKQVKQDIDIFVVHRFSEDILKIEKKIRGLKLPGELKVIHGSRDYFQVEAGIATLEIIPVVENKDPELAENVTDVSLAHVKYITEEIKKNPSIADEIRLSKFFAQAQRCYGAESYIKGFSGYSLEVLTIYHKGFLKMLKNIGKKKVIDPKRYFKNEKEVLREINASKLVGPLVVVDPTYKYRNVTAGLGEEVYEKFLTSAKAFLKKPSKEFFVIKELNVEEMKIEAEKKNAKFIDINLKSMRQEGDVAGSKMRKFFDFFAEELKRKKQDVLKKDFFYSGKGQTAKGYVIVKEVNEIEVRGPSVGLAEAIDKFSKGKKEVYRKGKYYFTKEEMSVKKVYDSVKKEEKEMGVESEIKDL